MLCPQCGATNPLGARRCAACGRPFTRAALTEDQLARGPHDSAINSRSVTPARQPRRRRFGCLTALGTLALLSVGGLLLALALGTFVVKPYIRSAAKSNIQAGIGSEVASQILQAGALQTGTVTITENDVNSRIATANLGRLDSVSVAFSPAGIDVNLSAYGLNGSYRATPRAQNGSVVLDGGVITGALGYVVSAGDLEAIVNYEIARALASAGYRVNDVALTEGALVLTLAPAG